MQIAERRTRDLEFLLSCPTPGATGPEAVGIGNQFAALRQQWHLSVTEAAQRMGGEEQVVLAIEYPGLYKKATFGEYLRYADALGCSLQEIFTADRVQAPHTLPPEAEEQVLIRVEEAIRRLQTEGLPVLPGTIGELVGKSVRDLHEYPRVSTVLNRHKLERNRQTVRLDRQREEELVKRVEQAIKQVEFLGKPETQRRVCKSVGLTQRFLERYPRVKALLAKCKGKRTRSRLRAEQQEHELLEHMEQAIKELEATGEPVLPRTIGMLIRLPFQRLDDYPRLKARFQQILDEYQRNQEWQRQRREEGSTARLQEAISTRTAQGKAITENALLKMADLFRTEARKYPRVQTILAQYATNSG